MAEEKRNVISRRQFIQGAAIGTMGIASAGFWLAVHLQVRNHKGENRVLSPAPVGLLHRSQFQLPKSKPVLIPILLW